MKKLRFFGLLVTVVLLAFGLSVGCNNDTTTTGGESDPVVYRGTSNGRAIEITFDTAPIPGRARATEPRPGDNYLITIDGQSVSSGWIELQEGGLIKFHDTTGKGDFDGQLIGQTVIVQVPGEPASLTVNRVGGGGTSNPGGGGLAPGGNVGGGTPGTTAPGATGVPGEFTLSQPLAGAPFVAVTGLVLASDDYIILDDQGNGSLQLAGRLVPSNAKAEKIEAWAVVGGTNAGDLASGTVRIDGVTPTTVTTGANIATWATALTGKNGLLSITGANPPAAGQTIALNVYIPDGDALGTEYDTTAAASDAPAHFTIRVFPYGTVEPPKITLVNGHDADNYIAGKSSIRITGKTGTTIYYTVDDDLVLADGTPADPTNVAGVLYTLDIPIGALETQDLNFKAIAYDRDGVASPVTEAIFSQAVAPDPVITLLDGDFNAAGTGPGFILGGGAKPSSFKIESSIPGSEIYYTVSSTGGVAATITAGGAAASTEALRYTAPVTVTAAMLNAGTGLDIQAITIIPGYAASTVVSTIAGTALGAAITQASVVIPVITVSGGVTPGQSTTPANGTALNTYALGSSNLQITSETKGVQIYFLADVDAAAPTTQATISAHANVAEWTTPLSFANLNYVTANANVTTGATVHVAAYATRPGYLVGESADVTLTQATVQAPQIRDPRTGGIGALGAAITITSALGWEDFKAIPVYSATTGATFNYTLTTTGPAGTPATTPTTAGGNVIYIDIGSTIGPSLTNGGTVTILLGDVTKTGFKPDQTGTATVTFTRAYP